MRVSDFALHILGEDNELRIGWGSSGEMTIRVEGERTSFSLCCGDTMEDFVFGWHKHCFTYKTNEYTKVCNVVYKLQLQKYSIQQITKYLTKYMKAHHNKNMFTLMLQ